MPGHPRHVVAVTGFVANRDGEVLLVRVASRGWEMPGGQVEPGEDLVAALQREVEEEAGCRVEPERLIGVYSKLTRPEMVLHLFRCGYVDGEAQAAEPGVPEVGWFSRQEATRLVTQPPSAQRLRDALAGRCSIFYRAYRLDPYEPLYAQAI
jgi:8-oxo-dGTP diphosphatase